MLRRKQIPKVAMASLVLGGGCGGDGGLAGDLCRKFERCDPEEFAYEYASRADCRDTLNEYIDEARMNYSRECFNALRRLYSCYADVNSCDDDVFFEQCEDEYYDYYDACYY